MQVSITAAYAAILALIIVALGINVTVHRVKLRVSLGDGGNPQMLRMIRLHANAIEYIPLALLLMLAYEINGGWHSADRRAADPDLAMWGTNVAGAGQTLTWVSIAALAVLNVGKVVT
jgi:hypothetical protein